MVRLIRDEDGRKYIRFDIKEDVPFALDWFNDLRRKVSHIKRMKDFKNNYLSPKLMNKVDEIVKEYGDLILDMINNVYTKLDEYKEVYPYGFDFMIDQTKIVCSTWFDENYIQKILNFHPQTGMVYFNYSLKTDYKNIYELKEFEIVIEEPDEIIIPKNNINYYVITESDMKNIMRIIRDHPNLQTDDIVFKFVKMFAVIETGLKGKNGEYIPDDDVSYIIIVPKIYKWIYRDQYEWKISLIIDKLNLNFEDTDEIMNGEITLRDSKGREYYIYVIHHS